MMNERINTQATRDIFALKLWYSTLTINKIINSDTGEERTFYKHYDSTFEMIPDLCSLLGIQIPSTKPAFSIPDFFATFAGMFVIKDFAPCGKWIYSEIKNNRCKQYLWKSGITRWVEIKLGDNCYIRVALNYRSKSDF